MIFLQFNLVFNGLINQINLMKINIYFIYQWYQQFQPGTGIANTPARNNITTLNDFIPFFD